MDLTDACDSDSEEEESNYCKLDSEGLIDQDKAVVLMVGCTLYCSLVHCTGCSAEGSCDSSAPANCDDIGKDQSLEWRR